MRTKRCKRVPRRRNTHRRNKRTRVRRSNRSLKIMRGGMVFDKSDEGCAFWPSIINENGEDPDKTVTKIFFSPAAGGMQRETEKYATFDAYDPLYLYHARLISSGDCTKEVMRDISPECYRKTTQNTNYINTEYVGKNVRDNQVNSSEFYLALIDFYNKSLDLNRDESFYLINSENHSGNICYNERYDFKYIDLGGVEETHANLPITDVGLIERINTQFLNIKGGFIPLSSYNLKFSPMTPGMTYAECLSSFKRDVLDKIEIRARAQVQGASPPPKSISTSVSMRPEKKSISRSRVFRDEPRKGASLFGDDSDSN